MSELQEYVNDYVERQKIYRRRQRILKAAIAAAVILAVAALVVLLTAATGVWTERQAKAHTIAEMARELGLEEDNPIIAECKRLWWEEEDSRSDTDALQETAAADSAGIIIPELELQELSSLESADAWYSEQDLNILAKVVWKEAEYCPWEHKCAVAGVVLNRVNDERFPNTIYDVVSQKGQYSASYTYGFDGIPQECYDAARAVLDGEYAIPSNVVWQAQFVQGSGVWWTSYVDTGYWRSTTYFCW